MSRHVCYLERSDRGGRVAHVRLVAPGMAESWIAEGDHAGPMAEIAVAARWVKDRLAADGNGSRIGALCVDSDGGLCSWLAAPSADAGVVEASIRRSATGDGAGIWGDERVSGGGVSLQSLEPEHKDGEKIAGVAMDERRLPVMSLPDTSVKLVLDHLNANGVGVDRVVSIWHAIALAWDPAGAADDLDGSVRAGASQVVATSTTPSAVVLVDASDRSWGRLLWSWSMEGRLLACGSIRLATDETPEVTLPTPSARRAGESRHLPVVEAHALSRLGADWMAWAAQLGVAPDRVVCVAPEGIGDAGGADGPAICEGLGRAVPGASIDLLLDDDPVLSTLERVARLDHRVEPDAAEDPARSLIDLSHRPGRAHRRFYFWTALTFFVCAVGLIGVAFKLWGAAGDARTRADQVARAWQNEVEEVMPGAMLSLDPLSDLRSQLTLLGARDGGADVQPSKPILNELEAVTLVLGSASRDPAVTIEIRDINLNAYTASIQVAVDGTRTAELLHEALNAIGGSELFWPDPTISNSQGKRNANFTGRWIAPAPDQAAQSAGGRP